MSRTGIAYITTDEQETTIQFSRVSDTAIICTSDSTVKTKLNKLCNSSHKHWKQVSDNEIFTVYECTPKSLISFRSKIATREFTDDQKTAMADRIRSTKRIKKYNK